METDACYLWSFIGNDVIDLVETSRKIPESFREFFGDHNFKESLIKSLLYNTMMKFLDITQHES